MNPDLGGETQSLLSSYSQSSFGPARLFLAPKERKALNDFYAYCRAVDDAADELEPVRGKLVLENWEKVLKTPESKWSQLPELALRVLNYCSSYKVPRRYLMALIMGARSDLRPKVRFNTQKELDLYCYRVAGAVGQACLPLFGVGIKEGSIWAETLGQALQRINFIRDVLSDGRRNRIYFTRSDFKKYGVKENLWLAGKPGLAGQNLLLAAAGGAKQVMSQAWKLRAGLKGDLKAADFMADAYTQLLETMTKDGLRVFEKRYRLSKFQKISLLVRRSWRVEQ